MSLGPNAKGRCARVFLHFFYKKERKSSKYLANLNCLRQSINLSIILNKTFIKTFFF